MKKELKSASVGYGSIYLDDNEDIIDLTEKQIITFGKQSGLVFVFFDIVCKPTQISEALAARGYVQSQLFDRLEVEQPWVSYVAIAFSDDKRPARDAMMEYLK